jgi:two-component system LytT family response regulator
MITALIVDDEIYARKELAALLAGEPEIEIVGDCSNAVEALKLINTLRPNAVFLDIQMPQISGLELAAMIDPERRPHIVFVTAYDSYALDAFEKSATDYLLKPVDPARLAITVDRLRGQTVPVQTLIPEAPRQLSQIPCFAGNRIKLVSIDTVDYAYSTISGVHVVTASDASYTDLTLRVLEEKTDLIRCHRQYLINLNRASEIQLLDNGGAQISIDETTIVPVSRRYLREIKSRIGLI